MNLKRITDELVSALDKLSFGPPVTYVYNPLKYARKPYDTYLNRYGDPNKDVVFIGMNPGPWGMAQTGVPFGEVDAVKNWLNIEAPVGQPDNTHPKRPVHGFDCEKSEVSGKRFWGWAKDTFKTADNFFSRFFIANYCPLLFFEKSGKNRTPNNIPVAERRPLLKVCDRALVKTVRFFKPRFVIGVGAFAYERTAEALYENNVNLIVGKITHPSPANPKANRGWSEIVTKELSELGIQL